MVSVKRLFFSRIGLLFSVFLFVGIVAISVGPTAFGCYFCWPNCFVAVFCWLVWRLLCASSSSSALLPWHTPYLEFVEIEKKKGTMERGPCQRDSTKTRETTRAVGSPAAFPAYPLPRATSHGKLLKTKSPFRHLMVSFTSKMTPTLNSRAKLSII